MRWREEARWLWRDFVADHPLGSFVLVIALTLLLCRACHAAEKHDVAAVPRTMPATLTAIDPKAKLTKAWEYGERCLLMFGARLQVVGKDGDRVLARYGPIGEHADQCPRGALIFFMAADFDGFQAEYEANLKHRNEGNALVQRLLSEEGSK